MILGAAIFASVVLILLVYHEKFRKVFFWIAGISVVLVGLFYLGLYLYSVHQDHVAEAARLADETAKANHKKLVDACLDRYSKSGYIDPYQKFGGSLDTEGTCDQNPNTDWGKPKIKFVEIHGGDTLRIAPLQKFSAGTPDFIPLVYLGHRQTFTFACGNYGEPSTNVVIKKGDIECP